MAQYHKPDSEKVQELKDIANKLRIHSIESTDAAKSGHPTSCCSAAEIMSVLFFHEMKYRVDNPRDPNADRFVISKGHAAPVLYAAWAEAGLFPSTEVLKLRKLDSDLEGHPTPRLNFVDVATGSLGQGLSCGAGMAYTAKHFDAAPYRVFCLMGDGESMEGSVWEAMSFASYYELDNLVAIFDVNRLGQSQETSLQHQTEVYRKRAEAFGWNALVVDGHDVEALCKALYDASTCKKKPTCIIAKTLKGKGCPTNTTPPIEDGMGWHGKPLGEHSKAALDGIRANIKNKGNHKLCPLQPSDSLTAPKEEKIVLSEPPNYKPDQSVATRKAYGTALVKIGKNHKRVIALDGDVKNSTFAEDFKKAYPNRFIECFIAEQNLVGVGIGCATRDRTIPFVSTFACFLSRAYDQIRMGAISQTNVNFCGSHAGISIGEDGPSQMALEDIAMFRSVNGSTVFYPCDAVSCERAVELAANTKGICFIRTSRPATPIYYSADTPLAIGKAQVLRQGDKATVIGCGVTLVEAMKAADELEKDDIKITVIDPFTVKPIDGAKIIECAKKTGGRIITVEDHYAEGGLGEAVCSAVASEPSITVIKLAVTAMPRSGPSSALMDMFGISANVIIKQVKQM